MKERKQIDKFYFDEDISVSHWHKIKLPLLINLLRRKYNGLQKKKRLWIYTLPSYKCLYMEESNMFVFVNGNSIFENNRKTTNSIL